MPAHNGYCFDPKTFDINLEGRGKPVPTALVLLLVPLLGALFLIFMPAIGFFLAAQALGRKIGYTLAPLLHIAVTPMPAAGEAHLTGHEPKGGGSEKSLEDLDKEIQARR
jgi:hypothetical protein